MAASTSIEWAANSDGTPGATWNPIRARDRETGKTGTFCVHASAGCTNCYAETHQQRHLPGNGLGLAYIAQNLPKVEIYLDEKMLTIPLRRKKPSTYFLSSMTDIFGEFVTAHMIDRLLGVMAACPRHTFVVLTKRAERMRLHLATTTASMIGQAREAEAPGLALEAPVWPLPNVILGVSVEDQANADARIPLLLATPAACRAISAEPLLGPVDLTRIPWDDNCMVHALRGGLFIPMAGDGQLPVGRTTPRIDWVICGGESGPKARPMHPDWARSLRDQCAAAGVPYFFKQWGEWRPCRYDDPNRFGLESDETMVAPSGRSGQCNLEEPGAIRVKRYGKNVAGRILDGRTHDDRPPMLAAKVDA